jgi:hypothetical protein
MMPLLPLADEDTKWGHTGGSYDCCTIQVISSYSGSEYNLLEN